MDVQKTNETGFDVGKDFFKPLSVNYMLKNEANQASDEAFEKVKKIGQAAVRVFDNACEKTDEFMKKNPNAVAGALLVAGSLVLPTMVGLAIPEVIDMAHRGVVAGPVTAGDIVGMIGVVQMHAITFNEGVKMMTNNKVDMFKSSQPVTTPITANA